MITDGGGGGGDGGGGGGGGDDFDRKNTSPKSFPASTCECTTNISCRSLVAPLHGGYLSYPSYVRNSRSRNNCYNMKLVIYELKIYKTSD